MLVATPGQTTAYSTLHNSSAGSGGGGGSNNTNATVTNKKTTTTSLNSTTATASSGTQKTQSNNNHTTSSTGINKNLLNSNTHATTYNNFQQNSSKNDNNVCTTKHCNNNSINNSNKTTAATSSRDKITSATTIATHSLKNEISTNITTTSSNKQSFIQTLKDSVQKVLISTTGNNSITNNKANNNNNNSCNNSTKTSIQNVTSSSTTTTSSTHNKVSTTTTSSTNSSNSSAATQSSSSSSLPSVRSKYFSCSLSKLHTVAPTIIHRYPEERQNASSTDSLQKEMCHFKPIRVAPTTPWKSGSKSRGNSLRFPKPNLATKKTEFILKSNCDVNNKKRKQQQIRTRVNKVRDDDDDKNEQENKEFYGIYKPKPSLTCLSTSLNTPNHQSAFVCLVAQMKNLVNIQSKKLMNTAKSSRAVDLASNVEGIKMKTTRSVRTITAATSTTISSITPTDKSVKELFVRQKQKPAKKLVQAKKTAVSKELPKVRSTRLASNAVKNKSFSKTTTTIKNKSKENIKRTNDKTNEISTLSKVSITKAKSRRNIGRAKTRMVNIVALANSSTKAKEKLLKSKSDTVAAAISIEPRKTRKRKLAAEIDTEAIPTSSSPLSPAITSSVKSLLKARKSTRATNFKQQTVINQKQSSTMPLKKLKKKSTTSITCFSPPLTRSRLKNLEAQGKTITTATTDTKKRRI